MRALAEQIPKQDFELSPIKAIELEAAKVPGAISLAQGVPSIPCPDLIRDYACQMVQKGLCDRYSLTNGLPELREELSLRMQQDEGLRYNPESEIIVSCGSIEAITASLLALTEPGDEVILPSPTYASYLAAIALCRCKARYVELDEERNFDFQVEQVEKAITKKTSVLLFCTPNNPTGTLYSKEKMEAVLGLAEKHNIMVLVDEVYKDFYYTDDAHFSPASIPGAKDRVIRACSFSKAYGMTGWRVGFLCAQEELTRSILKYHDAMVTCAPVVSQYAALAALRYGQDFLREFIAEYRCRRDYAVERLDSLSEFFDYQVPKASYFVFPRLKDSVKDARDSRAVVNAMLHEAKVALVPGVAFGPSGESHLRINFGREEEVLEQGFDRIEQYLRSQANSRNVFQVPGHKTAKIQIASGAARSTHTAGLLKRCKNFFLSTCAKLYLRRSGSRVIGICGLQGKTVFKRTLSRLLEKEGLGRSGILSYNTELGLPLSILNLKAPRDTKERLSLVVNALRRALFEKEESKYLVLEYGANSEEDARRLQGIATPDWLIITPIDSANSTEHAESCRRAVESLCLKVPAPQVVAIDQGLSEQLRDYIPNENLLNEQQLHALKSEQGLNGQFVGRSAQFASLVTHHIAQKLGLTRERVIDYLRSPDL